MNGLTCPKCQGQMRSYERSGITVDQCGECRGIFLDRGELEKLVDAETGHYAPESPGQRQPERRERDDDDDYRHREREYRDTYGGHGHHGKRKKKSFLEELFD